MFLEAWFGRQQTCVTLYNKKINTQFNIHGIIFPSIQVNSHCAPPFQCWSENNRSQDAYPLSIRWGEQTLRVDLQLSAPTQLGLDASNALMASQLTLPFLLLSAAVWSGNDKNGNRSRRTLPFKASLCFILMSSTSPLLPFCASIYLQMLLLTLTLPHWHEWCTLFLPLVSNKPCLQVLFTFLF